MSDLPVCTHVIEQAGAHSGAEGAQLAPAGDTRRSGARRIGGGSLRATSAAADVITLDQSARHRRRIRLTSDGGIDFLLDLPAARLLRDGDRLVLDDGRTIEVRAAAEALYEIRGDGAQAMLKLAWHIGNRHLPTEIRGDHLRIREDAVIRTMLEGLGADVREVRSGFDPEGGAYGDAGGDRGGDAGGDAGGNANGGHTHPH